MIHDALFGPVTYCKLDNSPMTMWVGHDREHVQEFWYGQGFRESERFQRTTRNGLRLIIKLTNGSETVTIYAKEAK